jgi:hypothetical protein
LSLRQKHCPGGEKVETPSSSSGFDLYLGPPIIRRAFFFGFRPAARGNGGVKNSRETLAHRDVRRPGAPGARAGLSTLETIRRMPFRFHWLLAPLRKIPPCPCGALDGLKPKKVHLG